MNTPGRPRVVSLCRALLPVWLLSSVLLFAQQPAVPAKQKLPPDPPHPIVPEMELLITNSAVTESAEASYPGPLSFGYLMEQLAGKDHAGVFTREWLSLWLTDQRVNGDTAPARPRMRELVLETWRRKDQQANDEDDDPFSWTPNLRHAPFKLIAVVNRMDLMAPAVVEQIRASRESAARQLAFLQSSVLALETPLKNREFTELGELFHRHSADGRKIVELLKPATPTPRRGVKVEPLAEFVSVPQDLPNSPFGSTGGYGSFASPFMTGGSPSGEGRLVFALTDVEGRPIEPGFNVIFEYSLVPPFQPGCAPQTPNSTEEWAAKWHHLGMHASFDQAYLRDLVAVTKGFTDERKAASAGEVPFPPSLSQLRTNDGVLDPVREFREFHLVVGVRTLNAAEKQVPPSLRQVPVGQTPAEQYRAPDNSGLLAMVLKTRVEDFRKEAPVNLPAAVLLRREVEPAGLLGARALLPGNPLDFHWEVKGLRDKALVRHVSLHTCNGCHGGDTQCDNGCHLKAAGAETLASAFLSNKPDGRTQGEMKDRIAIFKSLLEPGDSTSQAALVRILHRRHRGTH